MAGAMTRYAHTCEDGHSWVEQEDGGVSPSWGMGLTSVRFEQGPRACPEPARDDGRYECGGCGGRFYMGHGTPGVMSDPWNYDPRCKPPEPACGKPPVRTERWVEGAGRGKTRTFGGWEEILPEPLTNATVEGMIASAGNPEPQEVPMTTKPETAAQTVVVCGPNLSSAAQRKGDLHVHAEGCGDLKHYGPGRKFGGDTNGEQETKLRVNDKTEVAESVYSDHIEEGGDTAADYLSSFHFAPCVKLPEVAATPNEQAERIAEEYTSEELAAARKLIEAKTVEERVEQARKMLDGGDAEGALGTLLAPKPETVTLIAKSSAKTPWHFQADGARTLCGVSVAAAGAHFQIESDCDPRTVRLLGRPVCSNCAAKFNNGNTTTEEVNMSTTAATASTEARPDPKPSGRTGTRSSSGPGRGHAAPTPTATTPAKTTKAKATIDIDDGLDKALIAQVKKALKKPELTSPPSGSYTIIRSDGYKVGGYRPLSRKGLCVMLPAAVSAVKQAIKGADVEKFEKNVYRSRVYLTKAEQVPEVVKLLVSAAKEAVAADK